MFSKQFITSVHFVLDYSTMTYDSGRQFCIDQNMDLCHFDDICPGGPLTDPIITGPVAGDKWAPIRFVTQLCSNDRVS